MRASVVINEALLQRLPLPLAQLYRRAHNAKNALDRHLAAFYLWEAALKLLGCVAVAAYADSANRDADLAECLHNLARPSLGHWWEFVRRLTPVLADGGDSGFACVREVLLGRTRDDLPRVAGLDSVLREVLDGQSGGRTTVRLTDLFDRLVRYRNQELGHGAAGQKDTAHYDRVGRALLAGVPQLLEQLDVLAGRRLLHVEDVRLQSSGQWLIERYELRGETAHRLESLELPDSASGVLPGRVYAETTGTLRPLHPLAIYDEERGEVLFLNARRGKKRIEYLSYNSGRFLEREGLEGESRELLGRVLKVQVGAAAAATWAEHSRDEEAPTVVEEPDTQRRLGEFELLGELGRGGMGVVFRAWQPSLGRQVAVKKLFQTGDPKAEKRFEREIRALGRVEHPHLIKIFTSGSDGDDWFYAMELIEGASLADICEHLTRDGVRADTIGANWQQATSTACEAARKAEKLLGQTQQCPAPLAGPADRDPPSLSCCPAPLAGPADRDPPALPLPEPAAPLPPASSASYVPRVVELMKSVAEAAHALHEAGIVHRDIKPGNILVSAVDNEAVLMDLGLAQVADEVQGKLTRTRQFVGTLRYASPEQVLAVRQLDRRSDVYSLGATLWELLTLRPLFGATDSMPTPELMEKIQREEVERPSRYHKGLSRDLEAIVLKCLDKDTKRRYATAAELADDLSRWQAGEPVTARQVTGLERGWRWSRRNPWKVAVLCALLLVFVGLALWQRAVWQQQRATTQHQEALRQEDASDDAAVRAYLAADRIDDAREGVNRAYARMDSEPSLAGQRVRWDRLRNLVLFYHRAEEALFRAGEERYEEGRSACEAGLRHLDILDGQGQFLPEWWDRLPVEDVGAEQAERLQQEVYQQLLLLTYLRAVASLSPRDWRKPESVQAYRSASAALDQAEAYQRVRHLRPAQTVTVFRAILQQLLARADGSPGLTDADNPKAGQPGPREPTQAIDYFFSGAVHYYLHGAVSAPMRMVLLLSAGDLLDWSTPLTTAEDRLREAVRLDPKRFWTWFMLGRTLVARKKYTEAELAFATCVALRPEYPVSYQLRGEAICRYAQLLPAKEASRRAALIRRALQDAEQGLQKAKRSNNPAVYWSRGAMFAVLKDVRQALEAYACGLEQEQDLQKKVSRSKVLKEVREYVEKAIQETKDNVVKADAFAVLALVHRTTGDPKQARAAARRALAINPNHRRARAVLESVGES